MPRLVFSWRSRVSSGSAVLANVKQPARSLSEKNNKKTKLKPLIGSICQFLWHKYSHWGLLRAASRTPWDTELGRGVYTQLFWATWADSSSPLVAPLLQPSGWNTRVGLPKDCSGTWQSASASSTESVPVRVAPLAGQVQGFLLPLGNPGRTSGLSLSQWILAPLCHYCYLDDHVLRMWFQNPMFLAVISLQDIFSGAPEEGKLKVPSGVWLDAIPGDNNLKSWSHQ